VWPWLLALALILLGAVGGYVLYTKIEQELNKNTPVAVPDVRLVQQPLAVQRIESAGFKAQIQRAADATVAKGAVVSEDPGPGTKIGKGSIVTLTISTGVPKTIVPEVRGQKLPDALQALYAAGLVPKVAYVYSLEPADVVVGEAPAPKSTVNKSSDVHINVSRGPRPVTVPDVTGQPFANARSALLGQSFTVVRVDIDSTQPKGDVVASDPPPGTSVPNGSKVTLSVSKGPGTTRVPDVTGENQSDATATLRQAGFAVGVVVQPVTDPGSDGIVISQDPGGGQKGTSGETVVITVGQLSASTETTTAATTTAPTTTAATTTTATTTTTASQ
jgi:serine/threonine-protein kinase